jgi:hypothetical protein
MKDVWMGLGMRGLGLEGFYGRYENEVGCE